MTPHIESKKEDVSNIVLMPGDPLRAKYIAENFLKNAKQINLVRGMLAYTGFYKDVKVTVFASGMGMPSIGIYCYELFKFYNVEKIIRIGSCGTFTPDLKIFDTVLVDKSYTEGNFALSMNNEICHLVDGDSQLISTIEKTSKLINISIKKGTILCNDFFDPYMTDFDTFFNRLPKDLNLLGSEMESFALFYIAKVLNKKAACLLTVVDSKFENRAISSDERQYSLNNMIELALESSIK